MYNEAFVETLNDEHAYDALVTFLDMNPIGNLLLDRELNVVYMNKKLNQFWSGDQDETKRQFGNLFNCENAYLDNVVCGTSKQCSLCPIRSSAVQAQNEAQTVENVQVIKTFVGQERKKTFWLNMTFTPITLDLIHYIWVSIIDLSEMMNYKIDKYLNTAILEDEILIAKGYFHESVLNEVEALNQSGECFGLLLITCKVESKDRGTFDKLWLNKQLEAYQQMLVRKIDKNDRICRYESNQYLIFIKEQHLDPLEHRFMKLQIELEAFEKEITLGTGSLFAYRTVLAKINPEQRTRRNEQMHIEYFKLLSTLENLDVNVIYKVEL